MRAGVNACGVRLFSRYSSPTSLVCLRSGRQSTDRARVPPNVLVGCEWVLPGRIVQENAFLRPENVLKNRARQIRGRDARLAQDDVHVIGTGCCLRLNLVVVCSRKNQETSFGARVLNGCAHQRVDQPLKHDLTRNRFGHLDHGRQIEVLDGCLYRRCRIGDRLLGSDLRIELLELSNLCVRAPAAIAVAGIPQVGRRNFLEAARRVKASGPLVGDRLIVDKALGVRRTHGFLIEVLSVEHAAFNPGDFRTHDRCAILKGDRVVLGPHVELLVVTDESLEVLPPLVARGNIVGCRMRERTVEVKFDGFEV